MLVLAVACTATSTTSQAPTDSTPPSSAAEPRGIQKLDHLIFIVQENRSFDHYFGTYPGADGIPTSPDGSLLGCVPNRFQDNACAAPYVSHSFEFDGGPTPTTTRCATSTAGRWTASSHR